MTMKGLLQEDFLDEHFKPPFLTANQKELLMVLYLIALIKQSFFFLGALNQVLRET